MTNPYDAIIDDDLNPGQASQPPNPYDSIIDGDIKAMNTVRAQSSMKAAEVNPSQELEVRETAKRLNVEPDILRENMDEARRQLKTRDLEGAVSQFSTPSQAFLLENDNLGVVQEDLPRLKALEEALLNREQFDAERQARERGFLSNSLRGLGERADTLVGNTLEFLNNAVFSSMREATDSTSIGVFSMPIEEYERQGMSPAFQIGGYGFDLSTAATEEGAAQAGSVAAPFDRDLGYQPRYTPEQIKSDPSIQNIAGFIGEQGMVSIPDMLAAVFTTPAYVASRTQEIAEDRVASDSREGQPEIGDLAAAAPAAAATALIERFATNRLFNPPTRTVGGTIAAGVAREAGTEFIQEQIEYAGGVVGTETPFDIGESLERGAFGALAGGGIGGAVSSAQQVYTRAVQYNRARRDKDYLSKVGEAANASETNRDVLRDMIARAKGQGPVQEVYVDANQFRELFQSAGLDPDAIAERMPSVTEQYYESAAIGGDLAISLEDYATVIADTAVNSQFIDLVRTEQNGMSSAEAQQWYEEQAEPMIRAATEYDPSAENPGGERVFQDVVGQLIGTGMDQSTAERNASLYKAFFSVMGQYEGRDPFEIYQDYGLAINRPQAEILQRRRPVDEFDNMLDRLRGGDIPSQMEIEGQSLTQFLRERGGLIDDGGEVSALDIDEGLQAFQRRMIQEGGMSLDAAAEVAAEEGYITEADPNQLLEKLRDETIGNPAFSPAQSNDQLRTLAADLLDLDEALREAGLDPATMTNEEIREAINGNRTVPDPDAVEFDQAPPTDTEAFRNWFGDSKVVDENGDPLVVYHGTDTEFTAFDRDKTVDGMFWFTDDLDALEQGEVGAAGSGNVIPAYVSIQNPAGWEQYDSLTMDEIIQQGYDGLILEDGGERTVVAFNPEQIKSINNRGTFDPADPNILNQSARGRILIDRANQKFNIEMLEGADLSTFLHETGHYFLEVMGGIATDPAASERTRQMYADALAWMQVDGPEQIGTEQHELFARTFEAYLRDGKAPSAELQPFFQRFKAWLSQIYRSLLQLNANLTDEVRSVFDRMLATDEQIQQAQEEAGYLVSLMDIEGLAWTEDEQRRMAELRESARSQAEADLMADQMRDLEKAQQKWWKDELERVRQETWDSLNALPQYQARQMLTAGKRANGDPLPEGVEPLKLNKKALVDEFGEDFLKRLPSPRNPENKAPQYVYSREGGEDPGVVARMYGYPSVRAMVNDLINSRPVREYVEALSQAEMRDRHPDINLSGQAAETAKQSVYNDKQAQLMLLELKKLESMVGGRQTIPKVMRQKAAEMVAGMKVRDIRPDLYARKTSRYGREAFDAASRGDTNAAILAKQRELMHHYLYKEALKAREQSESVYRYAKRLQKKAAQERIGKAGGEYLERINGILEQYEFRRVTNKDLDRRQSLAQWLEGRQADGDHVDVPPEVVERSQRVNWREVPVEELLAARDALRNLEHVARNKNRLLADRDKRELEEVLRPVVDQILAKGDKAGKGFFADDSLTQKVKDGLRDYASAGLNMDTILRGLDGYEDLGLAYQAIKAPIDRAAREELPKRQQEYGDKLAAIYNERFTRAEQRAMGKRDFMQISDGRWLSREEALSVALNMGNEGNLEAVYSGVASAKDQLARDDVRLIKDSLGKADWDFVQDVWDMLDFELWPLVRDAQKARTGVAPQKVEATPVVTKFGNYRGGYYPIKFDSGLSFRATEQQMDEMAQQVRFGSFAKAQTRRGHTIERTNSGGNPLNYNLSVLHSHIETALVDVTLGDAINDVSRIITHRDFVNAMQRTGNTWALKAMENWLKDTASQEVISSHFLSKAVRHIRVGFTMSKLSWNVGTILLQPFGLAQSIPDIGYRNMMHGIAAVNPTRWMGDNSVFRQIEEKSPFMRTRGASFNKDIQATQQAMKGSGWLEAAMERIPGASRWSQGFAEKAKASLMGGIIATQRVVDGMVWMGAYQKGKQQFTTDSEAVQYADSMVARTQASGIFSDRTAFERGTIDNQTRQSEFVRLWTTLGSYMFAKGNVAYEKTAQVHWRNPDEVFKWMHDMFMLFTFEAILIGLLRNMLPEDEEDLPGYLAEETLYTVMSTMPIVREAASALGGFQGGGVLGSFFNDVAKVKTQAEQGEVDAPLLKSLNNVGGVLFKYPSSQTNRVFENLWKDMNGEDVEIMDYLLYREKDE